MTTETTEVRAPAQETDPKGVLFTMNGLPVLAEGRFGSVLAKTDSFVARSKVYAEGGENATHTHLQEDHVFFVLGGQATFRLGRDGEEVVVANPYEGVFLPRGAYYRFESSGDENLVMFRVGAQSAVDRERVGPNGLPLPGGSVENHHVEGVPVPGKFFGAQ